MARVIVADASIAIALGRAGDSHHLAARSLVLDQPSGWLMHPVTLAEVLVGPARLDDAEGAHARLAALGFRVDLPDAGQPVRLAVLRAQTRLKLPDCCVLDVALQHRTPLATFDRRLREVARSRGVAVVPAAVS
jgi:predicted nucleic acid-binding protein